MHKQKVIRKIGVDTGGTFTDIVMAVEGSLFTHKVLSTPSNPANAVIKGVGEILNMNTTSILLMMYILFTVLPLRQTHYSNVEVHVSHWLPRKVLKTF